MTGTVKLRDGTSNCMERNNASEVTVPSPFRRLFRPRFEESFEKRIDSVFDAISLTDTTNLTAGPHGTGQFPAIWVANEGRPLPPGRRPRLIAYSHARAIGR
jgi:hypothetical protein